MAYWCVCTHSQRVNATSQSLHVHIKWQEDKQSKSETEEGTNVGVPHDSVMSPVLFYSSSTIYLRFRFSDENDRVNDTFTFSEVLKNLWVK